MTQKEMIREHLLLKGKIGPMTALEQYGCYRLSGRIADLRADGMAIRTEMVPVKNRFGKTVYHSVYRMETAS